jgi:UDP-N-acetyl-2-amino-2-deoxyglucuronate dehydrogenase
VAASAANHIAALQAAPGRAELVAVCDNRPAALAAAVAKTGAAGFDSLDACWPAANADIVVLATPSGLHPLQAMRAAAPAATC